MGSVKFETTLVPRGPAAAIVLDDDQVAAVGEGAKRFPVQAKINGCELRLSVARMRGEFLLGLSKEARARAGVQAGDTVQVELELDTAPREVQVPERLAQALAGDPQVRSRFEALAYTHRKEFARWVAEAKRPETQERRVAETLAMLRAGRTRS